MFAKLLYNHNVEKIIKKFGFKNYTPIRVICNRYYQHSKHTTKSDKFLELCQNLKNNDDQHVFIHVLQTKYFISRIFLILFLF